MKAIFNKSLITVYKAQSTIIECFVSYPDNIPLAVASVCIHLIRKKNINLLNTEKFEGLSYRTMGFLLERKFK